MFCNKVMLGRIGIIDRVGLRNRGMLDSVVIGGLMGDTVVLDGLGVLECG